jgi:hypothetical protein
MLGSKSHGGHTTRVVSVGAIWVASKLGGLNIRECLQPREKLPCGSRCTDKLRKSRPCQNGGKAGVLWEETDEGTRGDAGVWGQASKERHTEITSGKANIQQGLATTCKDPPDESEDEEGGG